MGTSAPGPGPEPPATNTAGATLEFKDVLVNVEIDGHIVELRLALTAMVSLRRRMHRHSKVAVAATAAQLVEQAAA